MPLSAVVPITSYFYTNYISMLRCFIWWPVAALGLSCDDGSCAAHLLQVDSQKVRRSASAKADAEDGAVGASAAASSGPPSTAQADTSDSPVARLNAAGSPEERLALLRPLAWVHTPKCGTGFMTTLYGHPGICPSLPDGAIQEAPTESSPLVTWSFPDTVLLTRYPENIFCRGSVSTDYTMWDYSKWHVGIGSPLYESNAGHIVTIMRQPEQRVISSYRDHLHEWSGLGAPKDMRTYAEETRGCQVKMLTRSTSVRALRHDYNTCADRAPPTEAEVDLAVRRLREGVAFIGLMEQWDLSVCLFHAKFGSKCADVEFQNYRPGNSGARRSDDDLYDTSELRGFTDEADGRLYHEAVAIFQEDLARFGVSVESCRASCWPSF